MNIQSVHFFRRYTGFFIFIKVENGLRVLRTQLSGRGTKRWPKWWSLSLPETNPIDSCLWSLLKVLPDVPLTMIRTIWSVPFMITGPKRQISLNPLPVVKNITFSFFWVQELSPHTYCLLHWTVKNIQRINFQYSVTFSLAADEYESHFLPSRPELPEFMTKLLLTTKQAVYWLWTCWS